MEIRNALSPSVPVRKGFKKPTRTKQAYGPETDINNIMARFEKTGIIEHTNRYQGSYGDFTDATDYHSSLTAVIQAQESFNSLPSKLRASFDNDPGLFLDFVSNPDNIEEMREMGLLPKEKETAPLPLRPEETGDNPDPTPAPAE